MGPGELLPQVGREVVWAVAHGNQLRNEDAPIVMRGKHYGVEVVLGARGLEASDLADGRVRYDVCEPTMNGVLVAP